MSIIHYKARAVLKHKLPGFDRLHGHFRVYGYGSTPVDRTACIRFPVKTTNLFPLPAIHNFDKSYEECCDERAVALLERAERLDVPVYVFWSGGIDSTTVLVSLIKAASIAARERITVLMSSMSIAEYPDFYVRHIRGKFHRAPASQFPFLLGERNLIINGEHNDQLFGSDIIADAVTMFGFDKVMARYDPHLMRIFLAERMSDERLAQWYVKLYEKLAAGAPVPLTTTYHRLWWNNFALKWQNVFIRMLSFADRSPLDPAWVMNFYEPFFCSADFQRWSMVNLDSRVRGDWRGYKWPAKDVIYDFTKDERYRDNKLKLGSLKFLTTAGGRTGFIDSRWAFHDDLAPEVFYQPANDFVEA